MLSRLPLLLLVPVALACAEPAAHDRPMGRDDFGHVLRSESPPTRIVSLSPSTTELLFALGAGERLVGRTQWDQWPDSARLVPNVGPGLRPNVEVVLASRPDLVILYASADNRPAAERLRRAGVATLALKIDRIADFRRAARLIGSAVGEPARAAAVIDSVDRTLGRVGAATRGLERPRVFWHVWDRPLVTIGGGSYLDELVRIAGGQNIYSDIPHPSPAVALEDVIRRAPDVILAAPDRARRLAADAAWRAVPAARRVLVVDTTLVGRPSVRLGEAAVSLVRLLHPEIPL